MRTLLACAARLACAFAFLTAFMRPRPRKARTRCASVSPSASPGRPRRPASRCWRAWKSGATTSTPRAACSAVRCKLVYYDDQANPANAPGIYAKLMSVDKVDLLIGPYSTNVIAATMPSIIQANRTTIGIFGLGANREFKYPRYFSMNSQGSSPRNYSGGFFEMASRLQPKLTRVALVGADVEFSRNAIDGARENAKALGFEVVYERAYPVGSTEFTAIVRAMQATNPDIVYAATLPPDTVGLVRAASEVQFRPKLFGGAFLGLLVTPIKQQLGALMNGLVNNEFYIPAPSLQFTGTREFLDEYQKRAPGAGIDPLGYTYPPYAYAAGQILAKAVTETKSTRRRQARRLHPRQHVRHHHRPDLVRTGRRVGEAAHHLRPVPERQRQRHGAVQGHDASRSSCGRTS